MKPYYFAAELYFSNKRKREHNPGPYEGQLFLVPRKTEKDIPVRLYRPKKVTSEKLPVLFNVHGGGWVFGDAEGLDLQSQYLANHLNCFIVNIDYELADRQPFPYQQIQVKDVIEYFFGQAEHYQIDPEQSSLVGYSAGGHIAAGAAILLRDKGIKLCTQVLCYPFLNFIHFDYAAYTGYKGMTGKLFNRFSEAVLFENLPKDCLLLSPGNADPDQLRGLPRTVILACEGDMLLPQAKTYAEKLKEANVPTVYREVKKAEHGFMEHNFRDDPAVFLNESEQDSLMRSNVDFILEQKPFQLS